jgi:multidrug resistance efflux pump
MLVAMALLAASLAWCVFARVSLHETTSVARLEVDQAVFPVQSPIIGKVARSALVLGARVSAGDPLVEFDTSAERLQAAEERARLLAVEAEVAASRRQMEAETRAGEQERKSSQVAMEEARASSSQAEAAAQFSAGQRARADTLGSYLSKEDAARILADAEQTRFAVDRARAAVRRVEQDQLTREGEREVRIRGLGLVLARLEGHTATLQAGITRLDNEIERRIIRAPVDGVLAEAASLRVGAVLAEAEQVASLVPNGSLLAVARFAPPAALGRIAPGQRATMRLEGFPWAEYGALRLKVVRVAAEIRDGAVRVELALDGPPPPRIPLQHGLPGTVEVEVERTTPLAVILSAAGHFVGAPRSSFPAATR